MSASAASMIAAADEAAIAEDTPVVEAKAGQYDDAIKLLNYYGIYKGTTENGFNADAESDIQRYQMALFVARISTGWVEDSHWAVYGEWNDGIENRSVFDDLAGTYAEKIYGAISYANQKGIIEGYGNGKFGPTDGITYQNALTMVVRTLGYQNLAWPWGYIEKGVTLGLTKGVATDIAYTDVLTRGEVAQIIYNALFATTKDGDTLAARNFNGGLGWETIIITAAGLGRLVDDDTKVDPGDKYSDLGNKIAFKTVNPDGTLSDATYFVKNDESFKYEGHKEIMVGYAYKALFTMDGNSGFVKMIAYKNTDPMGTEWNFGLPTKDTESGKYPIQLFLNGYSLVSKYSKNTYLGNQKDLYGIAGGFTEMIVRNGLQGQKVTKSTGVHRYAIDWDTGNIIENTGTAEKPVYVTAWYFNPTLRVYFNVKTEEKVDGTLDVIGINILDEEEVKKIVDKQFLTEEVEYLTGMPIIEKKIDATAYASLKYFTLLDQAKPNYGIYEEYRLGKFAEKDVKCVKDNADKPGYVVYSLDSIAKQTWLEYKEAAGLKGLTGYDSYKVVEAIKEGACDHGFAWLSNDPAAVAVEDGDYVIYNYDKGTGELKVVKNITAQNDKDNFVTTGVVRAYNVANKTVTIGDTKYGFDYNELAGNALYLNDADNKLMERAKFTDLFRSLFNQYVNYVVCDGKLVYIEAANASPEMIVVDSYAGLSSDGYIVVNGYNTKDLQYTQFRIGSYNGWVKGDYYYYLTEQAVWDSFTRGSLYRITSYDPDADVYYVYTVAKRIASDYGEMQYNIGELQELGVVGKTPYTVDFGDKYKSINGGDAVKAKSSDRYVLICNPFAADFIENTKPYFGVGGDYAPIIVYTGIGGTGWHAEGWKVNGTDEKVTVLIGVDFNKIVGFNQDQFDLTYVLFLGYDNESASYNGADTENDWYLLGASEYTVRVFDLYKGEVVTKRATNKDLKKGYAYPSISGVVVNDDGYAASVLNTTINGAYRSNKTYRFGNHTGFELDGTIAAANKMSFLLDYFDKKEFSKKVLSPDFGKNVTVNGKTYPVADLSAAGLKVILVSTDDKDRIDSLMGVTKDQLIDEATKLGLYDKDNKKLDPRVGFWYIYDVDTDKTVVYITFDGLVAVPDVVEETDITVKAKNHVKVDTKNTVNDKDTAFVDAKAVITYKTVNDVLTSLTLKGLEFNWTGAFTKDTHRAVDVDKFHFGNYGYCKLEDWNTAISVDEDYVNYKRLVGSIDVDLYDPQFDDNTECDFIKDIGLDMSNLVDIDGKGTSINLPIPAVGAPANVVRVNVNFKDDAGYIYDMDLKFIIKATYKTVNTAAVYDEWGQVVIPAGVNSVVEKVEVELWYVDDGTELTQIGPNNIVGYPAV
jgi:hypothetical protein